MTVSSVLKKSFIEKPSSFYSIHPAEKVKWGSLEAGERSPRRASYRQDRETSSLPTRVLNAVSSPSFSAAQNSLPGFLITGVRREAQTCFADRPLPGRLSSKDGSERLNPPWSLQPFPDLVFRFNP